MPLYKGYVRQSRHKEGEQSQTEDTRTVSAAQAAHLHTWGFWSQLGLGNQNNTKRPKLLSDLRTLSKHSVKFFVFSLKDKKTMGLV